MFTEEEVFDLEVEDSHSFLTEVCAIHNCGSGTTAYLAEQWGGPWSNFDTTRVAPARARYPYYLLADSGEGQAKEAEVTGPDLVQAVREAAGGGFDVLIDCAFNYEEVGSTLNSDTSRPFEKQKSGRIAVKVINHLGDEVMKVFRV